MERNKYQKIIADILGIRPIAFNPALAKILGSAKAGLFLSQLLFWWGKGHKPDWIYKTIEEITEETTLSREEQDTAIKICKKFGVLEVKLMGIPAKRHFKLNIQKIIKLLESSSWETHKQVCVKPANLFEENKQTNTKNTTKITNINNTTSDAVLNKLIQFGISSNKAKKILELYDLERINHLIEEAEKNPRIKNRPGWVISALKGNWNFEKKFYTCQYGYKHPQGEECGHGEEAKYKKFKAET